MRDKTVLVIEDDHWLAQQYRRVLIKAGFGVIISSNAQEAINVIDDNPIDVIVLDVLLSGSTAFALLHELQSYGDTGKVPVIVCTNLFEELPLEDLRPYGVDLILDKTKMEPRDLTAAVNGALR
jgi:DNA-binding response OmpR family regulator